MIQMTDYQEQERADKLELKPDNYHSQNKEIQRKIQRKI